MKNKILVFFVLAFLFQVNNAFSQGCDAEEPADSTGIPKIKIFGFIQPEYNYSFTDPSENTFKFRRARIGVTGKVLEDFRYYFMLETSPFISQSFTNEKGAFLMDAFVAWEKYNWTRIAVGSFKQPFGLEVSTACNSLTTIDRAIVSDQLVSPQRDYGIMLLGGNKYNRFGYQVALMNGSGLSIKDNNSKKDIIGRATYKLFDFMSVGASFRYGYPINDNDSRTTYGGEILLTFNNLHIQSEYIYDTGDYKKGSGGCGGSDVLEFGEKRDGAYGMIWYDTKWNVQPVFKYEFFDQDLDKKNWAYPNLYSERMTIGINYFFNEKIRLQVNYQANIETVINVDNDKFLAQIQVVF